MKRKANTASLKQHLPDWSMVIWYSDEQRSWIIEPEVRQWGRNKIWSHLVPEFLSLIGWCIDRPLIVFSPSNSTDWKINKDSGARLRVSNHVQCCDFFFSFQGHHKFLYVFLGKHTTHNVQDLKICCISCLCVFKDKLEEAPSGFVES